MQYWKCKCGKSEFWGSGEFPSGCQAGCPECGTTLATGPSGHKPWINREHEFQPTTVSTPFGEVSGDICIHCHRSRQQIEEAEKRKE